MKKKIKNTKSDTINKGDYIEAIIDAHENKLQIQPAFLGWDDMVHNTSARFFNFTKNAPFVEGEAWLFKIIKADITGSHIKNSGNKIIVFSAEPITRIIDIQQNYYDYKSKKWIKIFRCGRVYQYKKEKIPAKFEAKIYKHKNMLHKLNTITDTKTGKIIQVLHFSEFTLEEFLEESQKKFGIGVNKISLKDIPEIPAEWLGKIKHFPLTQQN